MKTIEENLHDRAEALRKALGLSPEEWAEWDALQGLPSWEEFKAASLKWMEEMNDQHKLS